jgi:glycogen(starch) synthase
MAGAGENLHEIVKEGIAKSETISSDIARKYGILDKHTIEKACAKYADVFTTVSDLTSREAQYILGRKADVILPNGLDMGRFLSIDDLIVMKRMHRKQMRGFLISFFSRYYDIDFKNIRSMFISGRYEFHNKGIDLFIESLGKLNEKLKKEKAEGRKNKIAISFIFVPTKTWGENVEVLKNKALYSEMENRIEDEIGNIKDGILNLLTQVKVPYSLKDILSDEFIQKCRKMAMYFAEKRGELPPLCAFNLEYPEHEDAILNALRRNGLNNTETDQVKVIFYPAYLSSADRLIGMDYNDAILTFDLGVFPSYYESWGYTPLEAAAQGIPSVTTDLSGYGKFVNNLKDKGEISDGGVYVLKRDDIAWGEVVNDLAEEMYKIVTIEKKDLAKLRMNAKEIAGFADWKNLIDYYIEAHKLALEKLKEKQA